MEDLNVHLIERLHATWRWENEPVPEGVSIYDLDENVFYRAGIIERWGMGTLNIIDWCAENDNPPPSWQEQAGSVYVTFLPAVLPDTSQTTGEVEAEVTPQVERLLRVIEGEADRDALQQALGLKARKNFRQLYLAPAIEAGLIGMTIPDKPRSSKQRYRLTEKGR